MPTDNKTTIYTDGSCLVNPGPGGWGALVLPDQGELQRLSGGEAHTTNTRMELTAAIRALEALKRPVPVTIYTDSQYLRQGITEWLAGWKRKNWRTSTKQPVKNEDLWRELDALVQVYEIDWRWVKGHAGHPENERADELARMGVAEARAQGAATPLS